MTSNAQAVLFPRSEVSLDFRVVHYLGSKLRLLDTIRGVVGQVVPVGGRICDLFAGSGAVSAGLRHAWNVTSIDIQEYSRVLCSAILNPPHDASAACKAPDVASSSELLARLKYALEPVIEYERLALREAESGSMDRLCEVLEHGSLFLAAAGGSVADIRLAEVQGLTIRRLTAEGLDAGPLSVVSRYFGGVYFSWAQALELDAILSVAHDAPENRRDQSLAAALSVASDIVNTVGKQFAQPIRPRDSKGRAKFHLVRQTIRDRNLDALALYRQWLDRYARIPAAMYTHQALRGDFEVKLNECVSQVDLVYADPPYTRDHYSRYYHVLETMALRDEPEVSTTTIRTGGVAAASRGIYRKQRHQSPFCIKSRAPGAFNSLCQTVARAGKPLLLSYSPYKEDAGNRPRLLTISELRAIAEAHFDDVSVLNVEGVNHNKLNTQERNVSVEYAAEILMLCRIG